jgi:radical SAM superfamily enzyme
MTAYLWGTKRRINAASNYLKKEFGFRIQKLTIDAGFTCPNRDGTKGIGGCVYCNNEAFNPSYCTPEKSIHQQIRRELNFMRIVTVGGEIFCILSGLFQYLCIA